MAGISTDVCLVFAALSGKDLGYNVSAVIDASGTWSDIVRTTAIERLVENDINIMSWFAVASELQVDWRNATGVAFGQLLAARLPFYGNLIEQNAFTLAQGQNSTQNNTQNVQNNTQNGQINAQNGQNNAQNGQNNTLNGQNNTQNVPNNTQNETQNTNPNNIAQNPNLNVPQNPNNGGP